MSGQNKFCQNHVSENSPKRNIKRLYRLYRTNEFNLKGPNTELILNLPLKQTNTMKNEFSKSVMNDNKQAFVKSRALGKSTN